MIKKVLDQVSSSCRRTTSHCLIQCWPTSATACDGTRASFQYQIRRLTVRPREVSKPRDLYSNSSYCFETWHTLRGHCCRGVCQISERSYNSRYRSHGFETLRVLTIRRLIEYWNRAQVTTNTTVNIFWETLHHQLTSSLKTWYLNYGVTLTTANT